MARGQKLSLIQIILIALIILFFIRGFFANCIFLDPKYSDRNSCISGELTNAIFFSANKTSEVIQDKVERKMERIERSLSGITSNMASGALIK